MKEKNQALQSEFAQVKTGKEIYSRSRGQAAMQERIRWQKLKVAGCDGANLNLSTREAEAEASLQV